MPCMALAMKISFVGHSHHRVTQSSRFFIDFLERLGDIAYFWDETWQGKRPIPARDVVADRDLVVVWQSVAYAKRLAGSGHPNIVYVPMYDAAKDLRRSFWQGIQHTKILNFSSALHQRVQQFGCHQAAYFQYFPNPEQLQAVADFSSLRGFFWQRQRHPCWTDIRRTLTKEFQRVHLHLAPDPGVPDLPQPDAADVSVWRIEVSRWFPDRSELFAKLRSANVYFAPRPDEGIGLSFLEAMAMGMAVCAPDTPTHNEYIVDGINGYLYDPGNPSAPDWSRAAEMGHRARRSVEKGFSRWQADQQRLAEFLTQPNPAPRTFRYARPPNAIRTGTFPAPGDKVSHGPTARVERPEGGRRITTGNREPGQPFVTLATVVRNAPGELAFTLDSMLAQTYPDREILVIDGGSDQPTLQVLAAYGDAIDYWRSEPDKGPYDAMNKAADLATGRYILFIQAGDSLVDDDALARWLQRAPEDADFIAGHLVYLTVQGIEEVHRCADFEQTYRKLLAGETDGKWISGIPGHQALLTRTELLRRDRYDTAFSIAADHEFMYRMYRAGARFHTEPLIVSQYLGGGLSSRRLFECLEEWRTIALRYTGNTSEVERRFRRLFIDTLRYARRQGPYTWHQPPVRGHLGWALAAEFEFRLRALIDRLDALYARGRAMVERA